MLCNVYGSGFRAEGLGCRAYLFGEESRGKEKGSDIETRVISGRIRCCFSNKMTTPNAANM